MSAPPETPVPAAAAPPAAAPPAAAPPAAAPPAAAPPAAAPVAAWSYELRGADGRAMGLHDLFALRAMLYTGEIDVHCRVRAPPPGPAWPPPSGQRPGDWIPLAEVPALREVMDLLGIEPADADGERRIAGWQRAASPDDEQASGPQEISQVIRTVSPPSPHDRLPVVWLVVGTGLLLLVFLVIGLVLS